MKSVITHRPGVCRFSRDANRSSQLVIKRSSHVARAFNPWQTVIDESTGKTYYWNVKTNETSWDLDYVEKTLEDTADSLAEEDTQYIGIFRVNDEPTSVASTSEMQSMMDELIQVYKEDKTSMYFYEKARSLRSKGVFEEPFFLFLKQHIDAQDNEADKLFLENVRAKLSNPLVRIPSPFEIHVE